MGGGKLSSAHNWRPPRPPWLTILITFLICVLSIQCVPNQTVACGSGINTIGGTFPKGDIVLEYDSGNPLDITCVLDPEHKTIKKLLKNKIDDLNDLGQNLIFHRNSERIPKEYVTVINSTAARLIIPKPPAGIFTYYCKLLLDERRREILSNNYNDENGAQMSSGKSIESPLLSTVQPTSLETSGPPPLIGQDFEIGVCLNTVSVGYKPLKITNYTCISSNWESLTCNWTKPDNPVKTTYKIYFRLPGRAGGRIVINCPTHSDMDSNTCYWDERTNPIYRRLYEYYYFTLIGENVLGNSTTAFRFHHYAHVIPTSPTNVTVVDKTQSSAMLRWFIGSMATFPRDLVHKIEYKSQWDSSNDSWHSINVSDLCNTSTNSNSNCHKRDAGYYYFNVTDLMYPFALYDFRIYLRSSLARGEDKWSIPGYVTMKTKPSIPKRPPLTDVGSFESVPSPIHKSSRDIFIYWQHIDDSEKNGDLFEYRAFYTTEMSNNQTFHQSNVTHKNYALFQGLSNNIGYNFVVYSANKEGLSSVYSAIYVPSEAEKIEEPLSFTKMAFENGTFELSWKHNLGQKSTSDNQITDYTIFWCENDKDRPYQCNGFMNWKHVPRTETIHNVTVQDHSKIYQFAISANRQSNLQNSLNHLQHSYLSSSSSSSSGMIWASCTVLHNNIVGKVKVVWVNMIGSSFMELRWKLDCSDRVGAVLGFHIFYCPIISISNSACKEPMLNKTVHGETAQGGRGNITQLKPYTTYMVTIALITKQGEGLHSEPQFNTTLEGAPDVSDMEIYPIHVTNTSISLQWTQPKSMNGILRNYQVHFYRKNKEYHDQLLIDPIEESQRYVTVSDVKCRLDNLDSYTLYKIAITACTTICSERSNSISVQTAVGVPGRIDQPAPYRENRTSVVVSWSRPEKPAGPVDYYQLNVFYHSDSNLHSNDGSSTSALLSAQNQENSNNFLYESKTNECRIPVPDCNDIENKGQQTFSFSVRAVNNNPLNSSKPYYGQWSIPGSVSCSLPGLPLALHLVIWSSLFIVLTTVSTYWGHRFWNKYKVMHNVQVVLPPTLNTNYKFDHYDCDKTIIDSSQHYYVEDDHIIYDDTLPSSAVVYNATSNISSGSCIINSSQSETISSCSGEQNTQRWSPATATTVDVMDNDSISSNHHNEKKKMMPEKESKKSSNDENEEPKPSVNRYECNDGEQTIVTISNCQPVTTTTAYVMLDMVTSAIAKTGATRF
ncbi:cytokine receptor [Daktulosphaira vitifoliae]|uniref:cytokine receptor n=1 Tax=Daktulosphaira vitifoliae TaxID=58002 RepID=UPI0021AA233A|nr:cytokine receptor [Daktulosphaira vitifoliae]XP_050530005.1 cytokine receptor [Daktulosphaira vitifoliae]